MKVTLQLVDISHEHGLRWETVPGESEPKVVNKPLVRVRFATKRELHPAGAATDPEASFELVTDNRSLFNELDLSKAEFALELTVVAEHLVVTAQLSPPLHVLEPEHGELET